MKDSADKLEDNAKDALEAYLRYMWRGYYKWYEKAVADIRFYWLLTQTVAIVAGFGTAVLAALSQDAWFQDSRVCRILLMVLPLVGTLAGSIAANARLGAQWTLREQGRLAMQRLVDSGRQRFAAAKEPAEYSEIHASLTLNVDKIETWQADGFFPLLPDQASERARTTPRH
jgi:hypothetical protein